MFRAVSGSLRDSAAPTPAAKLIDTNIAEIPWGGLVRKHLPWRVIAPALILCWLWAITAAAQSSRYQPKEEQIPPPDCLNPVIPALGQQKICEAADYTAWLDDITHWRKETRIRMGYSDELYLRPEFQWSQSSFIQPQMMIEDRYFAELIPPKGGLYRRSPQHEF